MTLQSQASGDGNTMSEWKRVDENTPKDRPLVVWCEHNADPYHVGDRLTTYAAHAEGLGHAVDGLQIVVWGGELDDQDDGYIPPWWFVEHSDWEEVANPTHWLDVHPPTPPKPKKLEGA